MARKGNHQKNGVDRCMPKQKKKGSESVSTTTGKEKNGIAKDSPKEKLLNGGDRHGKNRSVVENIDEQNHEISLDTEAPAVDSSDPSTLPKIHVKSSTENMPERIIGDFTEEIGIQTGSDLGRNIKRAFSSLLNTMRNRSPAENVEVGYNAALKNLRVSASCISRKTTKWLERQKPFIVSLSASVQKVCARVRVKIQQVYPIVLRWLMHFGRIILLLSLVWLDCALRGIDSFIQMGTTSFFSIVWCSILSVIAVAGMMKMLILLAVATLTAVFLGFTLGLVMLALSGSILLWLYGSFWTTVLVIILGSVAFMLSHERIALFILATYSLYCAWGYVGWLGLLLAFNLSFISSDALIYFVKKNLNQPSKNEEPAGSENSASHENGFGGSNDRGSGVASTSGVDAELSSEDEVARLLNCTDHYSVLGLARYENVDVSYLKREYKKKAMLVHPDKNMGNEKAADAFKRLQNAYEVLLDLTKRKTYDDELRREELLKYFSRFHGSQKEGWRGVFGSGFAHSDGEGEDPSRDSRQIACKKCGNFHAWVQTEKSKSRARFCKDCRDFHQAKEGDGWVEQSSQPIFFGIFQKVNSPSAYVCADSKVYDATEWYICQGMRCAANSHKPSFHVNTNMTFDSKHSGCGKGANRGKMGGGGVPNRKIDETMTEEEFLAWLQNAVQAGVFDEFNETSTGSGPGSGSSNSNRSKRKKKGKKQW